MARIKGPKKVHRYSAEFKVKAVKLSDLSGVQVKDVAEALDIHPFMLSRRRSWGHPEHEAPARDLRQRFRRVLLPLFQIRRHPRPHFR